jgi:hypothetical protein
MEGSDESAPDPGDAYRGMVEQVLRAQESMRRAYNTSAIHSINSVVEHMLAAQKTTRMAEQMLGVQETIRRAFTASAMGSISSAVLEAQKNSRMLLASEALQSIRRVAADTVAQTEALRLSMATAIAPAVEQWSLQLPKISSTFIEQLRPAIEQWKRAWEEALPPNWKGFDLEEIFEVVSRIEETGYCLVWLPRGEILREVMAADASNTTSILRARRDDILDDATDLLGDVTDADLALERDAAKDAIGALRDGHTRAAQALAASIFTSAAHAFLGMPRTSKIRQVMAEKHPEEAGLSELRLRTIFVAGAEAFAEFRPDKARPVRYRFNRHNTAHRITQEQWTEDNALRALMLAAAFVRELNVWFGRRREALAANGNQS